MLYECNNLCKLLFNGFNRCRAPLTFVEIIEPVCQGASHQNIIALYCRLRCAAPVFRTINIATNVLRLCRHKYKVNAFATAIWMYFEFNS